MKKDEASKRFLRVVDANFNRAKEGLRVCEDICRFWLDKQSETRRYKLIRHQLTGLMIPLGLKELIVGRDVRGDKGRSSIAQESRRQDVQDIFYANSQRVKESLRVLEEFAKLRNNKSALKIKALRYQIYDLERAILIDQNL